MFTARHTCRGAAIQRYPAIEQNTQEHHRMWLSRQILAVCCNIHVGHMGSFRHSFDLGQPLRDIENGMVTARIPITARFAMPEVP